MRDKLNDDPLWFKDAIFYEVYVRGFYDSKADGVGDFRGLTEKLDHIQWLGVDRILLLPIHDSPLRDGGYDVSNYYAILPEYGTLDDFKHFLDSAHTRGIRAIADLTLNHTSDQHPWFQESRRSADAPKRDWYVGMGDNIYLSGRDSARTPMQWSADRNAGFSQADFAHLYFPVITDSVYGYHSVNVEAQMWQSTSLLHWVRGAIAVRKRHPVFGRGSLELIEAENRKILAFTRRYRDEIALCVYNLARSTQPTELDLSQYEGHTPVEMSGRIRFPRIERRPYQITFNEYGFFWFLLQKDDG
jgi:glycosidase